MLLDHCALEPLGNLKSVYLKIDFADFIDFELSHFLSNSKNSYIIKRYFNGQCNSFFKNCSLLLILPAQVTYFYQYR